MNPIHVLLPLVRADVRERTRSYRFLLTIGATIYLCYLVADGTIGVHLGEYRGVMNAAWVGILMTLCGVTFVSLAGFYVVKNAVERDRTTGVGQILAATPMTKRQYLAAKALSNFVVLALMMVILALAAALLLLFRREEGRFDPGALLLPFLILGLPAMAFVAALAVFFESVPLLRHGFGNVVFFFAFSGIVALPLATGTLSTDALGLTMAMGQIQSDIRSTVHDYSGSFSIGINADPGRREKPFRWEGMAWTPQRIGTRALPVAYALALVFLSALFFDRFDNAPRAPATATRRRVVMTILSGGAAGKLPDLILFPLSLLLRPTRFGRMVLAELRLMIRGWPWWWYLTAGILWSTSLGLDLVATRANLLPWLWVWPIFLWSTMGSREEAFRTNQLIFSMPRPIASQLSALWMAGFLITVGFASGILLRLLLAGDYPAFFAMGVGATFIPSLAVASGVWSGGGKMFEAVYIAIWYLGPLHHLASLDFMATTDAAVSTGTYWNFLGLAIALAVAAVVGRQRQLAHA